ncbi:MAG TPA: UDP-glucose--hexose-1-phosphate uridylyltransferase [Pyrinomonadaceae bacterium]|nr:UDP-glucose--hexose-1-phosphate uridylyltransferase [Pyrinomonadaceae bacterium]
MNEELYKKPHRRFNPLTGEWLLVSPHRTQRPWQGQVEDKQKEKQPEYDPTCYLCPRNERAGGAVNPDYENTFVFTNDYSALLPDTPENSQNEDELFIAQSERGLCRVVCFSPRHDLTLAKMTTEEIRRVVDVWAAQYEEIGAIDYIKHVQIFENRGAMMGASNPHPHGQIWANENLPNEIVKELKTSRAYFEKNGRTLLSDYLQKELEKGERIVHENEHFVALVPFWAVYPFETMIVSRRQTGAISELSNDARNSLADILRETTANYDLLFDTPFPYTMGFHQRPTDGNSYPEFHLHAHFYPPLLRSATIRKFMVGYELLGSPQRDITPEIAAEMLRNLKN